MAQVNHMRFMTRPYIRPDSKFATSKSWKNSGRADALVVTRCARYVQKQRGELGLQSTHSWRAWRMTQQKTAALRTIGNVKAKAAWTVWKVGCEGCCVDSRLWKWRTLEAVKGKAVWVMSDSNQDLVRMKENGRSRRDDVTLGCKGVCKRHRNWINNLL